MTTQVDCCTKIECQGCYGLCVHECRCEVYKPRTDKI